MFYVWGVQKVRGHDSLRDRPAPNRAALRHRPAGLSVGTGLTGAMAAPAASRLPLASSNKFDQYGSQQPSCQARREGASATALGGHSPPGVWGCNPLPGSRQ